MTEALLAGISGGSFFDWFLGAVVTIVGAITSALVYLYKDNKADRKTYSDNLERMIAKSDAVIERSSQSREQQSLALQGLTKAIEELRSDIRERQHH